MGERPAVSWRVLTGARGNTRKHKQPADAAAESRRFEAGQEVNHTACCQHTPTQLAQRTHATHNHQQVALTDADPCNSCLYVIPAYADPGYMEGDPEEEDAPDPLSRALSSKVGLGFVCVFGVCLGQCGHEKTLWGRRHPKYKPRMVKPCMYASAHLSNTFSKHRHAPTLPHTPSPGGVPAHPCAALPRRQRGALHPPHHPLGESGGRACEAAGGSAGSRFTARAAPGSSSACLELHAPACSHARAAATSCLCFPLPGLGFRGWGTLNSKPSIADAKPIITPPPRAPRVARATRCRASPSLLGAPMTHMSPPISTGVRRMAYAYLAKSCQQ